MNLLGITNAAALIVMCDSTFVGDAARARRLCEEVGRAAQRDGIPFDRHMLADVVLDLEAA